MNDYLQRLRNKRKDILLSFFIAFLLVFVPILIMSLASASGFLFSLILSLKLSSIIVIPLFALRLILHHKYGLFNLKKYDLTILIIFYIPCFIYMQYLIINGSTGMLEWFWRTLLSLVGAGAVALIAYLVLRGREF